MGGAFWELLHEEDRKELLEAGTVRNYATKATLYEQGRKSAKVIVLITARAEIVRRTEDGETRLAERGHGDILGELSLVDQLPHSATVRVTRAGTVLVLSHEAFATAERRRDRIGKALLKSVVDRLRRADEMRSGANETVFVRVVRLLAQPDPPRFQHELAVALGVHRSSVVRALTELRSRGVIATSRGSIRVLRPDLLVEIPIQTESGDQDRMAHMRHTRK